jgi:hypothetical protein
VDITSNTFYKCTVTFRTHCIYHFALEMSAKSWILVWSLVCTPCQSSDIAQDIVCCSWQMVRGSWLPDCRWREGSSLGTRVWIHSYPYTWQIRHWYSLETSCWILLWGQASWDSTVNSNCKVAGGNMATLRKTEFFHLEIAGKVRTYHGCCLDTSFA